MNRSRLALACLVCLFALLAACGSGGSGTATAISFSGTILAQATPRLGGGGTPLDGLAGVVVSAGEGDARVEATTDADGNFVLVAPPTGMRVLHLDGSGALGGTFPDLDLPLVIGGGSSQLQQPIVLPDLDDGVTETVAVDVSGTTTADVTIGNALIEGFSLDVPAGTTITVQGVPASGSVDLNVTPVERINVPVPLPPGLNPGAFVTIQPGGVAFDPPLGLTLPNVNGLAAGTHVDVWSFDHDLNAWVNRSMGDPARQGVVDGTGVSIVADGVIVAGGWHSAPSVAEAGCTTTVTGLVVAQGSSTPLLGALISLSTGQFGRTDGTGRYSIGSVPAYDASLLPGVCFPLDLELRAIAPVPFGSAQAVTPVTGVTPGGTTEVPTIEIPVAATGTLVGSVVDRDGNPVQGTVTITGDADDDLATDANGTFFRAAYDPGDYVASFTFDSQDSDSEAFTVSANAVTAVRLREPGPTPSGTIVVQVVDLSTRGVVVPVASACVTLVGATGGPLLRIADSSGNATFDGAPAGPYTVTAQIDRTVQSGTLRAATTLVGVLPGTSTPHVVLPFFDAVPENPVVSDATLDGTVQNEPMGAELTYQIASDAAGFLATDSATGGFSQAVPSGVPLDVGVVSSDPSTGKITGGLFVADQVATTGQTLALDLDLASAAAFDRVVPLTLVNAQIGHTEFLADLFLGDLAFAFSDGLSLPAELCLPSLSDAALDGLPAVLEIGSGIQAGTLPSSLCSIPFGTTTPTALTIPFLTPPTILEPVDQSVFQTYGPGRTVTFLAGAGTGSTPGLNRVAFLHTTGDRLVTWEILLAPGATALTLPAVFPNKPMFGFGPATVTVDTIRFTFPGFSFPSFFDRNLPAHVAAVELDPICNADRTHSFSVGIARAGTPRPGERARQPVRRRGLR